MMLLSTLSMIDGALLFHSVASYDQYGYCSGFNRSIFMETGSLCRWNGDCESEPHTSNLFECLASLCRTRHLESHRSYPNQSSCSNECWVVAHWKMKERVQWARRVVFGRGGTIIDGWEQRLPLRIPRHPFHRKPILLSVFILDKFSLGKHQSSNITVPESLTVFPEPFTFLPQSNYRPDSHLSLLAMVDCSASWDQSIRTPWHPYFDFSWV